MLASLSPLRGNGMIRFKRHGHVMSTVGFTTELIHEARIDGHDSCAGSDRPGSFRRLG